MKLFLLSNNRAVLTQGRNLNRVCVIADGRDCKVNGTLAIGRLSVQITDGIGNLPNISCGTVPASFTDADGLTYDAGTVFLGHGGVMHAIEELDAVLTEATKVDRLERELAEIKDALTEIRGKVEYKGLDFITN